LDSFLPCSLSPQPEISAVRQRRGEDVGWLNDIVRSLQMKKSMLEAS